MPWDNKTLATLKAMGGGSGGGGVSSWNDLPDKPFGEETAELVSGTVAEGNLDDNGIYWNNKIVIPDLVRGETYAVVWDGVLYECVAVDDGYGGEALGNFGAVGGTPDTGEPFFIYEEENGKFYGIATKEAGTHTVSIISKEIKPIDKKYLPEALHFGNRTVKLFELSLNSDITVHDQYADIEEQGYTYTQTNMASWKLEKNIGALNLESLVGGVVTFRTPSGNTEIQITSDKISGDTLEITQTSAFYITIKSDGSLALGLFGNAATYMPTHWPVSLKYESVVPLDPKYLPMSDIVNAVLDSIPTAEEASF